jgi:hypothetical protein
MVGQPGAVIVIPCNVKIEDKNTVLKPTKVGFVCVAANYIRPIANYIRPIANYIRPIANYIRPIANYIRPIIKNYFPQISLFSL